MYRNEGWFGRADRMEKVCRKRVWYSVLIDPQDLEKSDTASRMVENAKNESNHLERLAIGEQLSNSKENVKALISTHAQQYRCR